VKKNQQEPLSIVSKALRDSIKGGFEWEVVSCWDDFADALGVFKVYAEDGAPRPGVHIDLKWPSPTTFIKKPALKEKVWADIETKLVPLFHKKAPDREPLVLTDHQLQTILKLLGEAKIPFEVDHPNGSVIGINKNHGVEYSLTSADVASMVAAAWLFKSGSVRLERKE